MKAVVVGGGITGCISAIYLRKKGMEVSLHELSDKIGGILADLVHGGEHFFNGCQYLDKNAKWFSMLPDEIINKIYSFNHTYSSYTALLDYTTVHHEYAGPVFNEKLAGFSECNNVHLSNLMSRLSFYPDKTSNALCHWFKGFNQDVCTLHHASAVSMQLSRIYFNYDNEELLKIKKNNKLIDDLVGVPRSIMYPDSPGIMAGLPVNGYDELFQNIKKYMLSSGIEIFLNSPVKPLIKKTDTVELNCRGNEIESDVIVWAGNPVPLLITMGYGKLDNPSISFTQVICDVKHTNAEVQPHYIQVYSKFTTITRIFIYTLGNIPKATIECVYKEGTDVSDIIEVANKIIDECGFTYALHARKSFIQKRHIFYTVDDYKKFELFEKNSCNTNIVDGAWWIYARDEKIRMIEDKINSHCLI